MPERSMQETLDALGEALLDEFDEIAREAHKRYRSYDPKFLIELSARAQATCTYDHMLAEADRRFMGRKEVKTLDIRGLKLWLFEGPNAVVRFKKMDEDGRSRNYPTRQAKAFDAQKELPGLPSPPVRITAGYWLDPMGVEFLRSQVGRPEGKDVLWCAAVVPKDKRKEGEKIWIDVTKQRRFG